jgi:polysaccharide biosynthesis/export protein
MRRSFLIHSATIVTSAFLVYGAAQEGQKPPVSLSPAQPVDPAKITEPAAGKTGTSPVDPEKFVLGVEDQITVSIWDDARFNGNHVIRPDGKISIQLLGEIQAAGRTPSELEEAINKAALTQLKTPHSTVNVVGVHSKHIYFDGDGIATTGSMDLVIPIHLLEAISARGGFKDFANKNKIRILRGGKPLMISNGNKKPSQYIKYSDITSGKHPESNPKLEDGDHVIVP